MSTRKGNSREVLDRIDALRKEVQQYVSAARTLNPDPMESPPPESTQQKIVPVVARLYGALVST